MSRYDGPKSLGESLRDLVARYRKVDLGVMEEIRRRWPELLDAGIAQRCEPEIVREGVLYVRVPSGAYAEAIRRHESTLLEGFSDLGERAPTSVRAVVGDTPNKAL